MKRLWLAIPTVLIILLTGCSHAADQAIVQQVTREGVYALTSAGVQEIPQFGAFALDGISQEIHFNFSSPIGQAAAPLGFVTNIPNAPISDAKVFLLPSMDAGHWHRFFTDVSDSKPIPVSADAISPTVFKVIPSELPNPATGFLCLWVKMPPGSDDRMYAIHIK